MIRGRVPDNVHGMITDNLLELMRQLKTDLRGLTKFRLQDKEEPRRRSQRKKKGIKSLGDSHNN